MAFGDLGQEEPTAERMDALGTVDVAISQLVNDFSAMTLANRNGFNLMTQVGPRIFIPSSHIDIDAAAAAADEWPASCVGPIMTVKSETLPTATTVVFMGDLAPAYQKLLHLPPCDCSGATPVVQH